MNEILNNMGLVESTKKLAEKGFVDKKNDDLLRGRLDKFLELCLPDVHIYDWQKDMILKMYKWMKDHPGDDLIFARGSGRTSYYYMLALMFRSFMYGDNTLLRSPDEN